MLLVSFAASYIAARCGLALPLGSKVDSVAGPRPTGSVTEGHVIRRVGARSGRGVGRLSNRPPRNHYNMRRQLLCLIFL